jgi:hypothetical protein
MGQTSVKENRCDEPPPFSSSYTIIETDEMVVTKLYKRDRKRKYKP